PEGVHEVEPLEVTVLNAAPMNVQITDLAGQTSSTAMTGEPFSILLTAEDAPTEILNWTIDWGDGHTSTTSGWVATHIYKRGGASYTVTATVTDGQSTPVQSNTITVTTSVKGSPRLNTETRSTTEIAVSWWNLPADATNVVL